jgi:hypothetical protein
MTANTQTDTSALEALNFVGRDSGERLDLWRHGLQGDAMLGRPPVWTRGVRLRPSDRQCFARTWYRSNDSGAR